MRVGATMKTKAKKKTAAKKAAKGTAKPTAKKPTKKDAAAKPVKEPRVVQVRKGIARMVENAAPKITKGLIGEAEKGQVPQAKLLLEMAEIFPVPEGEGGTNQDAVAKSLMRALGIPEEPITYDEEGNVVTPAKDLEGRGGLAEKKSGSEEEAENGARAGVPAPHESAARESAAHESVAQDDSKQSDPVE